MEMDGDGANNVFMNGKDTHTHTLYVEVEHNKLRWKMFLRLLLPGHVCAICCQLM